MKLLLLSTFLVGISTPIASVLIKEDDPLIFAFRFLCALTILQLPIALKKWRDLLKMCRDQRFFYLAVTGLIGTCLYWCEFTALKVGLSLSHITFLSLTVPAWVLIYEFFTGKGTLVNVDKFLAGIIGSVFLIQPFSWTHLVPVATSVFLAAFLISAKRSQEVGIDPLVCSFFNDLLPLLGITTLIIAQGKQELLLQRPESIGQVFIYAALVGLVPNIIFLYGLRSTKVVQASLVIMVEPILFGLIAIYLNPDRLGLNFFIGAALVTATVIPDRYFPSLKKIRLLYAELNVFR